MEAARNNGDQGVCGYICDAARVIHINYRIPNMESAEVTEAHQIIDQVQKRIDASNAETARVLAETINNWRENDQRLSELCRAYLAGELGECVL